MRRFLLLFLIGSVMTGREMIPTLLYFKNGDNADPSSYLFFFPPPTYNHWVLQGLNISAFRFCAKLQNTQIHLGLRLTVFSRIVAKGPRRFCATVAKDSLLLQDRDRGRSRRARRLMQRRGWKGDVEGGREAEKSVKKIFITCLHEGISYSRHRGLKQQFIPIQFCFWLKNSESQADVAVREIPVPTNWPRNILSPIMTVNWYRNGTKPGTNLVSKRSDSEVLKPHCRGYNYISI